jgi:hypothetical protein
VTVIEEPADAIAAGLCLAARTLSPKAETNRHPRPCGWCVWDLDALRQLVDGFNRWAGYSERSGTYDRHDARVFQDLPAAEQRRLVLIAQDFPDASPEPDEIVPEPPAEEEAPRRPSWFPLTD